MIDALKLMHLATAIVWLGGMTFALWALRPVLVRQLDPPLRLRVMAAVLARFFVLVWCAIGVLLPSGLWLIGQRGWASAPPGWYAMMGLGVAMSLVFAALYFGPFRGLKRAVAAQAWPDGARHMASIHAAVVLNFCMGWLAVFAVRALQ